MKTLPFITPKHVKVGTCDYVMLACGSREEADTRAFNICRDTMLPVYFGSGYTIDQPHILRLECRAKSFFRFIPAAPTDSPVCTKSASTRGQP